MLEILPIIGLIIIILSLIAILVSENWRWTVLFLSIQYVGCFLLLLNSLPVVLAASKLIAGLIASLILGMALIGLSPEFSLAEGYSQTTKASLFSSRRVFRLLLAVVVALVVISIIDNLDEFIPGINLNQAYGSVLLIGLSIVQLSLVSRPFDSVVGLLLILSGFEILYSTVETSALLMGLLTVVDLGLALAGAYLIVSPSMEKAA